MQFLILLSCVFAFAAAIYPYSGHYFAQHVPVIDHNGVPEETHEVQVAKAEHLAAHAAASHGGHAGVYSSHYGIPAIAHDETPVDTPEVQLAKHAHFAAYHEAAARNSYHHGGHDSPVETPEVQHAKALHFAAHAEANARLSHHGHYRKRRNASY